MNSETDPFAHHPELRGKIRAPEESFFRTFKPSDFDERMRSMGIDGLLMKPVAHVELSEMVRTVLDVPENSPLSSPGRANSGT